MRRIRRLRMAVAIVASAAWLAGCGSPTGYQPQPPAPGVSEFWQIMQIRVPEDDAQRFVMDLGLATREREGNYSFWMSALTWRALGKRDHASLYELVIPNCCNIALPSTTVTYGQASNSLVQTVDFEQDERNAVFYISASQPLQWSQTATDAKHQTVSLVFVPVAS
ncbi:hypothetical protein [Alicyclobacillus acidocaldarius]|uniref:Lipoprotein n=1 Tax=Alicyclobacillus acidocaldarius subsp. acidocaldarius (strain ATCC 27009 / DSM 446 / BCRC 14685 / JCM 5260 / KCTC 1825 / NBRC 15652 / NCIMB 11725 / NRRL B-14509 / 104-IA) TaxID=521098 RepID=C8WPZ7_ALIAD|nr:hypothetical protein [Alicyclobacillus acidocaldarius]ACV57101.1 hypothetical protein Aaci_0037 [Alicyclobacillus acidocaldarius subsp. acidocaldarius DSM 446]